MGSPQTVVVHPATHVRGPVRPPGDKSISHRYALFAALARGTSTLEGYSTGADCASTLNCLRALGVSVTLLGQDEAGLRLRITGRGPRGFLVPADTLDAGNSGTTMRLLTGLLAAQPFTARMAGDESLSRRPMRRVIVPLEQMGARIASNDGRPPLTIQGAANLRAINFQTEVPSAQVKSAVLLAGLHADGVTRVTEAVQTRDHTERGLKAFGVDVTRDGLTVAIAGGQQAQAAALKVPGDLSSAAFWMVAAASLPDSEVIVDAVGLNPTRTAILGVLRRMGADVDVEPGPATDAEPMGRVIVRHGQQRAIQITPAEVPGLIDELPVLAALATHDGELTVTGAGELRVKESDRITELAVGLRAMGASIDEFPDGFHVRGDRRLRGGDVDARNDHRLAMAFAIAALGASGPTTIHDAGAAAVSYPEFFSVLESLRA